MKFKIIRSKFLDGLKAVQNIVNGKGNLPILQNVLIEAVGKEIKLTTTDLDISISTVCECEVIEHGSSTLPVKLLFNSIVKVAEGEVEVEVDAQERGTIKAGRAKYKIVGMPYTQFPKLPKSEDAYAYIFEQAKMKKMLKLVSYAASQDDTRRTLKGVLLKLKDQKVTMVATDGRRLALTESEMEFPQSEEKEIVLPAKAVLELQRSLGDEGDIQIMLQQSQICFKLSNITIFSKMVSDVYPNYTQVIPVEVKEHITLDRQLFIDAIERASVMTMDESHSIRMTFSEGKLLVSSAANDVGEAKDELDIKYIGETIEAVYNPNYILDALKVLDDDEITFNLNSGNTPAVIKCSSPFLYVLMPLRING